MRALAVAIACFVSASTASADTAERAWQMGVALRSDYGAHRVRLSGSLRLNRFSVTAILDPKVYVDTQQNDTDLLGEWQAFPRIASVFLGWRVSQIKLDRGVDYQHQLLLGAYGELPSLARDRIRARFGIELEADVVRHGAGMETEVLSFASQRHFRDLIDVNFCLRFELVSPL